MLDPNLDDEPRHHIANQSFTIAELRGRLERSRNKKQQDDIQNFKRIFPFKLDALLIDVKKGFISDDYPPLGLIYIGSYLKAYGMTAAVISALDTPVGFAEKTLNEILCAYSPKVVGMNVFSTTRRFTIILARQIKIRYPNIAIVIGGPEASADAANIMAEDSDSAIDFAICGEGEEAFLKICQKVCNNVGSFESIQGLVYRREGDLVHTGTLAKIDNIDSLPKPDFGIAPLSNAWVGFPVITARGCAYNCSFCFEGAQSRLRQRSIESVVSELRQISCNESVDCMIIIDDAFTTDIKRLHTILYELKNIPIIPWFCEGRADTLARHPELLKEMIDAGLCRLQMGFESGSQKVLDSYNKGITKNDVIQAVSDCFELGVKSVFGNFIIGGAFETEETFAETMAFAELLLDIAPWCAEIGSGYLAPHPGTEISRNPEKFDIKLIEPRIHAVKWQSYCVNRTLKLDRKAIVKMKLNFDHAIAQKMLEQVNTIPVSKVLIHLDLAFSNLFDGSWSRMLRNIPQLKQFALIFKQYRGRLTAPEAISDLPMDEWSRFTTVFSLMPDCIKLKGHKAFILVRQNKEQELSPIDQFILFNSDGSRTITELFCQSIKDKDTISEKELLAYERNFREAILGMANNFAIALIRLTRKCD